MSSKLIAEINTVYQQSLTPRLVTKVLVGILKHMQNNTFSAQHKKQIAFFLLRSFSLNNKFVNQLVYVCLDQLLPFDSSFVAINIIDKTDELGLRLLIKIVPEEMAGDFMRYIMECKDTDLGMLCLLRLHYDMVFIEVLKKGNASERPTNEAIKEASSNYIAYYTKLKNDFLKYHKLGSSNMLLHYHSLLFENIERPFSSFYRENYNQKYPIIGREMAGAQQARTTDDIKDHLNAKISGEICFTEALRKVGYMKDPTPFLNQAITNAGIWLNGNDDVVKFSILHSLETLSKTYPKKVAVLNPSLLKINDDCSLRILLRTGDSNTIERIANTDLTQYDDEKALLIVKAFGKIAQKNGKEDEMARFLKPLMFKRSSLEMKKEIVRIYGELMGNVMIDDECAIVYDSKRDGHASMMDMHSGQSFDGHASMMDMHSGQSFTGSRQASSANMVNVHSGQSFIDDKEIMTKERRYIAFIMEILTEYLEDCQYSVIANDILGLINDKKYLVSVYNRLILENEVVLNNAMLCINRLTGKKDFSENEDDLLKFYFYNKKTNVDISRHLTSTKTDDIHIKKTRPVVLLDGDLKVTLTKSIYKSFVYIHLLAENKTKNLYIQDGKMVVNAEEGQDVYFDEHIFAMSMHYDEQYRKKGVLFFDCCFVAATGKMECGEAGTDPMPDKKTTEIDFGIKYNFYTSIVMKRRLVLDTEYTTVCTYDLFDRATEESEHETKTLHNFNVNYLDTIKPFNHGKNPPEHRKTSFAIENKSPQEAKEDILDLFNLQIVDQNYTDEQITLKLEGTTIDSHNVSIGVVVERMDSDVSVYLDVYADSCAIVDKIMSVVQ